MDNHTIDPLSKKTAQKKAPRWVWTALKVVVSFALIVWLALRFDMTSVWHSLQSMGWFVLVAGLALMIVSQLLCSRRLQILLAAQGVSLSYLYSVQLTFVGLFVSNFLPSTVGGDVVKVFILTHQRHGATLSIVSVLADRMVNGLVVILLLPSLFSLGSLFDPQTALSIENAGLVLLMVGLVFVGGIYTSRKAFRKWLQADQSRGLIGKVKGGFVRLIEIVTIWARQPSLFVWSLLLSLGSILASVFGQWIAACSLGISISYVEMLAIAVLVYFVTLIPVSLNGLGTQEVSLVYLLMGLGATESQSLALAVVARLIYVVPSLLGVFGVPSMRKQQEPM